jgi:hypothetical protein
MTAPSTSLPYLIQLSLPPSAGLERGRREEGQKVGDEVREEERGGERRREEERGGERSDG